MSGEWPRAWRHARRILCVRLDSLSDVLMCTPAFRALRDSLPGCRLTLLASPSGAAAAGHILELDEAIAIKSPWMMQEESMGGSAMQACVADLASHGFDAAVIFTSWSHSPLPAAMLCHLAGIPLRLASCRENPYQLLSHWVPQPEHEGTARDEVQRQLDLVAQIGCRTADTALSFAVPDESERQVHALLTEAGIDPAAPYLVLHAGASAPSALSTAPLAGADRPPGDAAGLPDDPQRRPRRSAMAAPARGKLGRPDTLADRTA